MSAATVCPNCGVSVLYSETALKLSPVKLVRCPDCGHRFKPKKEKTGRTDSQRRSQQQEKRAARRYNARQQPGSGAMGGAKGDIRDRGVLRGECKVTTKKSFSLKLEELMKIEKEARGLETPLFEVQFQGAYPYKTYVVLPADEFQALRDQLQALREETGQED